MLKHRLVQAVLLVVPATAGFIASATIVQAAEECRLKPGAAAPSGSRWLYRINADHRHCWHLSSKTVTVRSQLTRGHHPRAADMDAVRQDQQPDSDLQTASAPTDKTNVAVTAVVAVASQAPALVAEPPEPLQSERL